MRAGGTLPTRMQQSPGPSLRPRALDAPGHRGPARPAPSPGGEGVAARYMESPPPVIEESDPPDMPSCGMAGMSPHAAGVPSGRWDCTK